MRGMPIITFINKMDRAGPAAARAARRDREGARHPLHARSTGRWARARTSSASTIASAARCCASSGPRRRAPGAALDLRPRRSRAAASLGEQRYAELQEEIALLDTARRPVRPGEVPRRRALAGVLRQRDDATSGSSRSSTGSSSSRRRRGPQARASERDDRARTRPTSRASSSRSRRTWIRNHRDRVAFVRVCSGRFARGMEVNHVRTGRPFTMSRTMQFLAQERITVDEAYAGDILGVWDGGSLRIGDTLGRARDVRVRGRAALLARALRAGRR